MPVTFQPRSTLRGIVGVVLASLLAAGEFSVAGVDAVESAMARTSLEVATPAVSLGAVLALSSAVLALGAAVLGFVVWRLRAPRIRRRGDN